MNKTIKHMSLYICLAFTASYAFAESLPWFKDTLEFVGKPLVDTTILYRKEGLVIIDADKNYISFSGDAKRLDTKEREITGEVEKKHDFVISFSSCEKDAVLTLSNLVSTVTVKQKHNDANELMSDLKEIVSYFEKSPEYSKASFGISKSDQFFMGFKRKDNLIVEFQWSQDPNTLILVAAKKCENQK